MSNIEKCFEKYIYERKTAYKNNVKKTVYTATKKNKHIQMPQSKKLLGFLVIQNSIHIQIC